MDHICLLKGIIIALDLIGTSLYGFIDEHFQWNLNLIAGLFILLTISLFRFVKFRIFQNDKFLIILKITILVCYNEVNLYNGQFAIFAGYFQSLYINEMSIVLIYYIYVAIRLTTIQLNEQSCFAFYKSFLLIVCLFLVQREKQAKKHKCTMIPLELLTQVNRKHLAIYKNDPYNCIYSNFEINDFIESLMVSPNSNNNNSHVHEKGTERISPRNENQNTYIPIYGNVDSTLRPNRSTITAFKFKYNLEQLMKEKKNFKKIYDTYDQDGVSTSCNLEIFKLKQDIFAIITVIPKNGEQQETNIQIENLTKQMFKLIHDMKTPLNAIINLQQCLQDYLDDFLLNRYLKPSLNSSQLLMNLLEDMLDLAQLKSNKLRIVFNPFNLQKMISKTLQLFEIQAEKKHLQFNVKIQPGISIVNTDKNRLRQILLNLISNALKYTPPKGSISLTFTIVQPKVIQIEVEDSGIGIKKENISLLFEDFNKVNDSENVLYNPKGVGLGLQISKELAYLMGSKIGLQVSSEYGKGTKFTFQIDDHGFDDEMNENLSESEGEMNMGVKLQKLGDHQIKGIPDKNFEKHLFYINNCSPSISININQAPSSQLEGFPKGGSIDEVWLINSRHKADKKSSPPKFMNPITNKKPTNFLNEIVSSEYLKIGSKRQFTEKQIKSEVALRSLSLKWNEALGGEPPILVVDDNEYNIMAFQSILEQIQVICDSAISGQEAIEKVSFRKEKKQQYRLVFMDIEMPQMDGFETTRRLLSIDDQIKVIACSGWEDLGFKQKCASIGMYEVLHKPVRKLDLKNLLKRVLECPH